jgi:hypothetical protein
MFFVTLGLGSVIASAVSAAPWLAVISRHKNLVIGVSGTLLALNYWLVIVRPRRCAPGEVCHVDSPLMRWNRRVWWFPRRSTRSPLRSRTARCLSLNGFEEYLWQRVNP